MEAAPQACGGCRTPLALGLKSCPGCGVLVHRQQLEELYARATQHERSGEASEALVALRRVLELLPQGTKQYVSVEARVRALSAQVDSSGGSAAPSTPAPGWLAALGALGLVLWKAKWLLASVLGKGKFLLLGLTKLKTLLTMFVSLGAYWAIWGWKFALGLVLSMYAHEMGHVAALTRLGVRASAPMFVPGLGALVRSEQRLTSPHEEARVAMAGPIWGGAAALACYGVYRGFDAPLFGALAGFGAWLNLLNLVPFWLLDGSRVFSALGRGPRLVAALMALGCAVWSGDAVLYGVAILAAVRAFQPAKRELQTDHKALLEYLGALLLLTFVLVATRGVAGVK